MEGDPKGGHGLVSESGLVSAHTIDSGSLHLPKTT